MTASALAPARERFEPNLMRRKLSGTLFLGACLAAIGILLIALILLLYDVLVRGGTLYDGSGLAPYRADVGVVGDRVVALGDLASAEAELVIDAAGLAVAPGFVNVLSWAVESLIEHPARMTHASASGSPLEVPADLIRLSVGLEHSHDLVADLQNALG